MGPAGHPSLRPSARLRVRFSIGLLFALAGRASAQAEPPERLPPPPPGGGAQTCTTECHKEITRHKVIHGPAQQSCDSCHIQGNPEEHKFYFVVPKEELCQKCHQLPHAATMHKPVADGKCLSCHDPHGSDQRRMLVADPKRELCLRCHTQDFSKFKFVHGPVAVGACIICHLPHSSANPKLLVQDPKSLCLTCHSEVLSAADAPGMHKHGALELGCTRCHSPHASDHKFQLHEEAPGLCLSCHQDKFSQMIGSSKVVHGAVTQPGGCTGCHAPHTSKLPSLQRDTQPGICLTCHNQAVKTAEGATLTNMGDLLAKNPDHHGPIREGVCTACHSPHAGDNFRMLKAEYPAQFYAPFNVDNFKLCFSCHISDLVLKPSGRGLTNFRDGDRNLHFVHVNQQKGRTCRACHEVHASKRPFHIREAVPFGTTGWLLEINYQKNENGGSCSPGCHKPRSYDRLGSGKPLAELSPFASPGATAAPSDPGDHR